MITKIEWTATYLPDGTSLPGYTFNPWWGCTKVSPACRDCYAEKWAKRWGHQVWGADAPRRTFEDKHWNQPLLWNKKAAVAGVRAKVFCASMSDWAEDRADLVGPRMRLFELIKATPNLIWLLLTKRADEKLLSKLPADWGEGYPNVWLGTTIENQNTAEKRLPHFLTVPAVVHFVSCEPLLSAIDFTRIERRDPERYKPGYVAHFKSAFAGAVNSYPYSLDWVITGGESGDNARPSHPQWFEDLLRQCHEHSVPFFFKQWGEWQNGSNVKAKKYTGRHRVILYNGDYAEWDLKGPKPFGQEIDLRRTYTSEQWNMQKPHVIARVGKKEAGRMLVTEFYNEMPQQFDRINVEA